MYRFIGVFFLILSSTVFFYSQKIDLKPDLIVEYDFTFQPDSTNVNSKVEEKMSLYIHEKKSFFESSIRRYIDSVGNNYHGQVIDLSTFPRRKVTSSIYKDFQASSFFFIDDFLEFKVKYQYSSIIKWTLLKDEKRFGSYKCNLAKANFGGRVFYAWYTTEIPIPDGPYKFCGLPGLIVSVYDSKKFFVFDLVSLKKIDKNLIERNYDMFSHIDKHDYYIKKNNFLENKYRGKIIVYNPLELTIE